MLPFSGVGIPCTDLFLSTVQELDVLAPAFARGILLIVEVPGRRDARPVIVVLTCRCQSLLIHQLSKAASRRFEDQPDARSGRRRLSSRQNCLIDRLFHLRSHSIRTHPFLVVEK